MLICNNKLVLNKTLNPSTYIYNPDDGQLIFRKGDPRNEPTIKYDIGDGVIRTGSFNGTYLKLPLTDTYYDLNVNFIPTNSKYIGNSKSSRIYMNNPACQNFVYESKYSDTIIEYQGTDGTVVVPPKHNMVETTTVNITEFPNVTGSSITIETPETVTNMNIKDTRITSFNIKGLLNTNDYEFANLPNLKTFTGKLKTISPYMFQNDSKLTTVNITNATLVGTYAFKGCSALTTVNIPELTTIHSHGFENCKNISSINLDNCISVGSYGFAGCSKLDMAPGAFKNLNSIGSYSFYDTPIKSIRLKTSTLPIGCFDYSKNPFQKVIFTSLSNINGLNNNTLRDGTYTDGMLYNGNKKHQIYCDITDDVWSDSPSDGNIIHGGYDQNKNGNVPMTPGEHKFDFYTDNNAFGIEVSTEDSNRNTKTFRSLGNFESTSIGRRWSIDKYNLFGNLKPSFYSELKVKYIDNQGLHDEEKEFFIYGDKVPEPVYKIKQVYAADGTKNNVSYKFTKNSATYLSGTCPKGHYYVWLVADAKNTNISMVIKGTPTETQAGEPVPGLNGQGIQHLNLTIQDKSTQSQGFLLYKIDLADYYDLNKVYERGYNAASFFYREYRFGYDDSSTLYGNSWNGKGELITSKFPMLNSWKDLAYLNYDEYDNVGTPEVVFWTTQDNTTLYLNGEVFQEGVPAYRLYIKGRVECPRLYSDLFLYNSGQRSTLSFPAIPFYRYIHNINKNFGYIDFNEILEDPTMLFVGVQNTYRTFSPHIWIGYAHNNLENDFIRSYTQFNFLKSLPSEVGYGTPRAAITSVFDDELSPEIIEDIDYSSPPDDLPDTKTAYIGIEKVFCNMATSSSLLKCTYTPTGTSYNVWDGELWLHFDRGLVVRVEIYDENNEFLAWFDNPTYYTEISAEDVYSWMPYGSAWPIEMKATYKLRVYYRDNPSYGKFTIDLTNKSIY